MLIRLFDIENGIVRPTEHCYLIPWLHQIMKDYEDCYMKVYAYLFYMTCPNPELNPYFNVPEDDKEQVILDDLEADFSTEDEAIQVGLQKCAKLYETSTARAYKGFGKMLDRLAKYMETTNITHGRDGNLAQMVTAAKNFDAIRQSFKGVYKDLQEEQASLVRGGQQLAYDT